MNGHMLSQLDQSVKQFTAIHFMTKKTSFFRILGQFFVVVLFHMLTIVVLFVVYFITEFTFVFLIDFGMPSRSYFFIHCMNYASRFSFQHIFGHLKHGLKQIALIHIRNTFRSHIGDNEMTINPFGTVIMVNFVIIVESILPNFGSKKFHFRKIIFQNVVIDVMLHDIVEDLTTI